MDQLTLAIKNNDMLTFEALIYDQNFKIEPKHLIDAIINNSIEMTQLILVNSQLVIDSSFENIIFTDDKYCNLTLTMIELGYLNVYDCCLKKMIFNHAFKIAAAILESGRLQIPEQMLVDAIIADNEPAIQFILENSSHDIVDATNLALVIRSERLHAIIA